MIAFIQSHGADALILFYVFSAFVSSMPDPPPTASVAYVWLYGALHALSGDLSQYIGSRTVTK